MIVNVKGREVICQDLEDMAVAAAAAAEWADGPVAAATADIMEAPWADGPVAATVDIMAVPWAGTERLLRLPDAEEEGRIMVTAAAWAV